MSWFLILAMINLLWRSFCTRQPNVVLMYIENIDEVTSLLSLIERNMLSKDALPNIYKLKMESISFHNVYGEFSSSSNFASLLTGKAAADMGLIRGKLLPFDYFPSLASIGGLNRKETTIAELLRSCGYKTWFTGYWKLGLGVNGQQFPTEHGFDTWMGTAHPHSEWCHRTEMNKSSVSNLHWTHPYTNLFYKTSFLWIMVFFLLTSLAWFRFMSFKLYVNLLIYTFCTSLAFYVFLNLFMIQRSASCVLYYHDFIYEQPYELKNLTLHFTQHSRKLIEMMHSMPFFMVLNYMKMSAPLFHSNQFCTKSTDMQSCTLLELDWSVGEIISKLKEKRIYNETVIILTGSKNRKQFHRGKEIEVYERLGENKFRLVKVFENELWSNLLNIPLLIKDVPASSNDDVLRTFHTFKTIPISDVFVTILEMTSCHLNNHNQPKLFTAPSKTQQDLEAKIHHLNTTFIHTSSNEFKYFPKMKLVVELEDDDVRVETYEIDDEDDDDDEPKEKNGEEVLFHYFNIEKPVAVTYQGRFQLMYASIDGSDSLVKLSRPVLLDMQPSSHQNVFNVTSTYEYYEKIFQTISAHCNKHLIERHSLKMWSSEFEMPVYPWLLPCANLPYCETFSNYNDFSQLISSTRDV